MKTCSKCKTEKDESEFYKNSKYLNPSCKECKKETQLKYSKENKDKCKEQRKRYYQKNKDKIIEDKRLYKINRRKTDTFYKLSVTIKARIIQSLKEKDYKKNAKSTSFLSCSIQEFQNHLGPKPEGNIELDHICPCAQAKNEEELIKLQHYSNFRWLSMEDNRSKKDKWTPEGEILCKILLGREWVHA